MSNILEVTELVKTYRDFQLDHISFQLKAGSIMGFIGENGAGKSTTIKSILNIIKIDRGQIHIFGEDAGKKSNNQRIKENIGVVLDECYFHNMLNAKEINGFMGKIYKNWDKALYFQYLERFCLPIRKTIKDYSRGMKMKLNIATALSHRPKLLILDEPTSGLDPVMRNEILDVFFDFIQDEQHSILMSSHITTDLERICDYITFIHQGKLILSESKDDILYDYAILKCTSSQYGKIDKEDIIAQRKNSFGIELLIKNKERLMNKYRDCTFDHASLEDIMLFYKHAA